MDLSEDKSRLDFFMRKRQKLEAVDNTPYVKEEAVLEDQPSCGYDWSDASCRPSAEPSFCKNEDFAENAAEPGPSSSENLGKEGTLSDHKASPGPSLFRSGSCGGNPHSEVAVKAEEWTGQEAFQEQPGGLVKEEEDISCSPFSNGTPPDQAASERGQDTSRTLSAARPGHSLEDASDREQARHWEGIEIKPVSDQPPAGDRLPVLGFSRRIRQQGSNPPEALSDQRDTEPSAMPLEARESSKDALPLLEADLPLPKAEAKTTPQDRVRSLRQEACEGPWRADSDKSSTEHVDFDVASIDVSEQEKILQSIVSDRQRMHSEIAKSLLKRRQSSMAAFLRKDKLLD